MRFYHFTQEVSHAQPFFHYLFIFARVQFMDLLRSLNMPIVEYGEEEYAQDLKTIADLTHPAQGAP